MGPFLEFLKKNRATLIGAAAGILIAVLFLTIGFFPTLLLAVLGGVGAFMGAVPAVRQGVKDWIMKRFTK